jgi:hypothetical protein
MARLNLDDAQFDRPIEAGEYEGRVVYYKEDEDGTHPRIGVACGGRRDPRTPDGAVLIQQELRGKVASDAVKTWRPDLVGAEDVEVSADDFVDQRAIFTVGHWPGRDGPRPEIRSIRPLGAATPASGGIAKPTEGDPFE